MDIKPLIPVISRDKFYSGGYRRLYEILKRGKSEGIDYVVVTDSLSYRNYVQMFPDFGKILDKYKSYFVNFQKINVLTSHVPRQLKAVATYWDFFAWATSVSKIARKENVDLIVGPSEGTNILWISYFLGRICGIPWTVVIHGQKDLFQPTTGLGPLNPVNVLKHVSKNELTKGISRASKLGFSIELLLFLKIAEKSLILTVSRSVSEEIGFLNPRIHFHVLVPGNGVDLKQVDNKLAAKPSYDGIFFSRLVPGKGLFDLPEIWKLVVQRFPKARLAVAGMVEDSKFVDVFQRIISQYGLTKNIVFLGTLDKSSILDLVRTSKLNVYPSTYDVFSLAVLESLACGIPTVAYDIPAVKHNFGTCKAVLRCPVKDKLSMAKNILFLLENDDLRTELSKVAKEYASNFDWKKVVKAEKEAYYKVIDWFNSHK